MPDMKQIHDFTVKWCDKFRDQNINYIELVDHWMADDCVALGFEMDCGHAFSERYGQAANNHEALNRILDDVTAGVSFFRPSPRHIKKAGPDISFPAISHITPHLYRWS